MNENTKLTFYWKDTRTGEVLREETRTLQEWTGLTDAAMEGWSVLHLDRVLRQTSQNWVDARSDHGWKIAD